MFEVLIDGNRYLEFLSGLEIIQCPLRCGFSLICSQSIQVLAYLHALLVLVFYFYVFHNILSQHYRPVLIGMLV
jgi:hypothetical protein